MKKFLVLFILSLAIFTAQAQNTAQKEKSKTSIAKTTKSPKQTKLTPLQELRVSANAWEQSDDRGQQKIFFAEKGVCVQVVGDSLIIFDQYETYIGKEKSQMIDSLIKVSIVDYLNQKYEHEKLVKEIENHDATFSNPLINYVDFSLIPNYELKELLKKLDNYSKQSDLRDVEPNAHSQQLSSPLSSAPVKNKKKETFLKKAKYFFSYKLWHLREF